METRPSFDRRSIWGILLIVFGGLFLLQTLNFFGSLPFVPIMFAGLGLAFAAVYLTTGNQRSQWWPIIPSGALLTMAAVTGNPPGSWFNGGAILFFGLGLTFFVLYVVTRDQPGMAWSLIPAAALWVLTAVVIGIGFLKYLFPVGMIAVGLYLLYRMQRPTNRP